MYDIVLVNVFAKCFPYGSYNKLTNIQPVTHNAQGNIENIGAMWNPISLNRGATAFLGIIMKHYTI